VDFLFFVVWVFVFVLIVLGICQGHGRNESEDEAQYRQFTRLLSPYERSMVSSLHQRK
jgi:hypothetical protein